MSPVILLPLPNSAKFLSSSDAFQRVSRCLRDACHHAALCEFTDCGNGDRADSFHHNKTWELWINNTDIINCFSAENIHSGIFLKAINLTTEHSLAKRYIYSLFWGLQVSLYLVCNMAVVFDSCLIMQYYFLHLLQNRGICEFIPFFE